MPTAVRVIDKIEEVSSSFSNGQVPAWNAALQRFEGTTPGGLDKVVELHIMSAPELLAGSFLLTLVPATLTEVQLAVVGGPVQGYGTDYTVAVQTVTLLSDLLSTLQVGDTLELVYEVV